MNQIFILYHHYQCQWNSVNFNNKLALLPVSIQADILKYRLWQDQQDRLIGKLLLLEGLKQMGYAESILNLTKNQDGKPIIPSIPVSFNISHSGGFIVCAFSTKNEIGIDIEKIKPIEIDVFKDHFSESEFKSFTDNKGNKNLNNFYNCWTQKEAVLKAHGIGITIPLNKLSVTKNDLCKINNDNYLLKNIAFHVGYSCHIAINEKGLIPNNEIEIKVNEIAL